MEVLAYCEGYEMHMSYFNMLPIGQQMRVRTNPILAAISNHSTPHSKLGAYSRDPKTILISLPRNICIPPDTRTRPSSHSTPYKLQVSDVCSVYQRVCNRRRRSGSEIWLKERCGENACRITFHRTKRGSKHRNKSFMFRKSLLQCPL